MDKSILNLISDFTSEIEKNKKIFDNPTVEKGTMGIAIFYYYCYKVLENDEAYLRKAEEMIDLSISLVSEISSSQKFSPAYRLDSLTNIFSSFGKGLLFIENRFNLDYNFNNYILQVSDVLEELHKNTQADNDYDFTSGKLSLGNFFLNKYSYTKNTRSKEILLNIYESLKKDAKYKNSDVYWVSPKLDNNVYLGISHGSAMIINFITKLYKLDLIDKQDFKEKFFLQNAVNFIYSQKRECVDGYFPNLLIEKNIDKTQFTLCYGDLGVLFALKNANSILKNAKDANEISSMLGTSMQRKMDSKYTFDGSLIYGAGGVFSVFDSLCKRYENEDKLKKARDYWYNELLEYVNKGNSFFYERDNKGFDQNYRYSFGWGLAGIGISLIQGTNNKLPSVEELLFTGI